MATKKAQAVRLRVDVIGLLRPDMDIDEFRRDLLADCEGDPDVYDYVVTVTPGVVEWDPGEDDIDPTFADFTPADDNAPNDNTEHSA